MKRSGIALSLLVPICAGLSWANQDSPPKKPVLAAVRALALNRSLLTRTEEEYASALKEREAGAEVSKRLSDLRYKIQALQDDAERLSAALPEAMRAEEFLKDLSERKASGKTEPVNPAAEKKLEQNLESIFGMHEKALEKVAEGSYGEAAGLYEEIVLLSPDDDEAYLLLGHSRLLQNEYERAAAAFRNAIHIDPSNAQEIPRLYESVLVENPDDDEALTHLGYARLLLGHAAEAERSFREALLLNPGNEEARKGLLEIPAAQ